MSFFAFILLVGTVILLSGLTIWTASESIGWALVPALSAVALVLTVLIRRRQ